MKKGIIIITGFIIGLTLICYPLAARAGKVFDLGDPIGGPPDAPGRIALEYFSSEVGKRTNGEITIKYHPQTIVTSETKAVEMCKAGALAFAGTGGGLGTIFPNTQPLALPYLLRDYAHYYAVVRGPIGKKMEEEIEKKHRLKMVIWGDFGFRQFANTKKPLNSPNDFKGLKLRVLAPLTQGPTLKTWGASAVAMAWGDVPSAIQSGVIDGAVTSSNGFAVLRQQTPYYSIIGVGGMALDFYFLGASKKWWDGLSPAHQKIIRDTLQEMIMYQRKLQWCSDNLVAKDFGAKDPKKPGMYNLKAEEVEVFKKALGNAVSDSLVEKLGPDSKELIAKFQEEGQKLSAQYPPGSDPVESFDCSPLVKILTYKQKK